jgi:3alpha(or 20beta)-hydroxysteroid dehydrogenase
VKRFQDKVVVITGAAGGIGRAAARRFASEGARLVLVDISAGGLEESRGAVEAAGGQALTVEADVTRAADVRRYVATARGGGAIVNTASVAGLRGTPNLVAYTASKHAVIGLTRTASLEFIRHGVRVNAVCPAPIDTPMVRELEEGFSARDPNAARARFAERIPMRRYGTPEEVAALVAFLCSDDAGFINGAAYPIDGGSMA